MQGGAAYGGGEGGEAQGAGQNWATATILWPEDFEWTSNGVVPDWHCTQIKESGDSGTDNDNYFCAREDIGMKWSYEGSIAGMKCTQITAPDYYLCVPQNSPLDFQWSSSGPIPGAVCIQWWEASDTDSWNDNYLCAAECGLGECI